MRASCALSLRRYRSRFAAAVLQVHVRGRLGEILPGPAAPSPDAATLCRPRKNASRHHIAATGHDWPLRQIRTRPSWCDDSRIALVAGKHVHARPHRAERRNSAIASAGAFKELHLDGIC